MTRRSSFVPTLCIALAIALVACDSPTVQPAQPVVPVKSTTLVFDVQGMHCNGCVEAITADVRAIAGVRGAQVSLENHTARVEVADPALESTVEGAIRSLGYTVKAVPAPKS